MIQVPEEAWVGLLAADPHPWLLTSGEPTAELVALTALLDRPAGDPDVRSARERVLADPGTAELIDRLPRWDCDAVTTGHNSPTFAPNLLSLLAHMGLLGGDSPVIDQTWSLKNLRSLMPTGLWGLPESGCGLWHYDFVGPRGLRCPDCLPLMRLPLL